MYVPHRSQDSFGLLRIATPLWVVPYCSHDSGNGQSQRVRHSSALEVLRLCRNVPIASLYSSASIYSHKSSDAAGERIWNSVPISFKGTSQRMRSSARAQSKSPLCWTWTRTDFNERIAQQEATRCVFSNYAVRVV